MCCSLEKGLLQKSKTTFLSTQMSSQQVVIHFLILFKKLFLWNVKLRDPTLELATYADAAYMKEGAKNICLNIFLCQINYVYLHI